MTKKEFSPSLVHACTHTHTYLADSFHSTKKSWSRGLQGLTFNRHLTKIVTLPKKKKGLMLTNKLRFQIKCQVLEILTWWSCWKGLQVGHLEGKKKNYIWIRNEKLPPLKFWSFEFWFKIASVCRLRPRCHHTPFSGKILWVSYSMYMSLAKTKLSQNKVEMDE